MLIQKRTSSRHSPTNKGRTHLLTCSLLYYTMQGLLRAINNYTAAQKRRISPKRL